jgi:hypothetical protein
MSVSDRHQKHHFERPNAIQLCRAHHELVEGIQLLLSVSVNFKNREAILAHFCAHRHWFHSRGLPHDPENP